MFSPIAYSLQFRYVGLGLLGLHSSCVSQLRLQASSSQVMSFDACPQWSDLLADPSHQSECLQCRKVTALLETID